METGSNVGKAGFPRAAAALQAQPLIHLRSATQPSHLKVVKLAPLCWYDTVKSGQIYTGF